MIVKRAYKVRLYPNKKQEAEMLKILAGCRFVWNYFLEKRQNNYLEHKETLPYRGMSRELTQLRKIAPELVGLKVRPLQQALRRLDVAYNRFFRKLSRFPRFKGEWDISSSFQTTTDWRIKDNKIQIQQGLTTKTRGGLPKDVKKIGTLVVKYTAGKWYASIMVEEDIEIAKRHTKPIGIDVGLTNLAVDSTGKKYHTLKPSYDLHNRMRLLQRKMARQEMGSNRREETRKQIARLYHKIENIRTNHLHQTTHKILEKNPSLIAIESLNVIGMIKNHKLARSLADVSLGEMHRQLKYKQIWSGGNVVEIDRFYPSTKTCSKCGYINEEMKLGVRTWECPRCGVTHDRDVNAARNILSQGMTSAEKSRDFVETQTS